MNPRPTTLCHAFSAMIELKGPQYSLVSIVNKRGTVTGSLVYEG